MDGGSLSDTQRTMVLPLLQETNIRGRPYVTVSAKGIVNGLSRYPNDGADFGPDTTKGATAPGQYGSPYTETTGIQEGANYAITISTPFESGTNPVHWMPNIVLTWGYFLLSQQVYINFPTTYEIMNFNLIGQGVRGTYIKLSINEPAFTYDTTNAYMPTVFEFRDIGFETDSTSGTSTTIFTAHIASGNTNYQNVNLFATNVWLIASGGSTPYAGFDVAGFQSVVLYNAFSGPGPQLGYLNVENTLSVNMSGTMYLTVNGITATNVSILDIDMAAGTLTVSSVSNVKIGYLLNSIIVLNGSLSTLDIGIAYFSSQRLLAGGSTTQTVGSVYIGTLINAYASGQTLSLSTGNTPTITNIEVEHYIALTGGLLSGWQNTVSTPAISTSAISNPNNFSVDVYIYGGTVTEIVITDRNGTPNTAFSATTGIAMVGQQFSLGVGWSITVTYSVAPTWAWVVKSKP